ncbi:MAG: acyl carrier protein [Acidobacteria bacterium 13_1_20CM_2_65_9]|nr:MAG: acyl carrier protein [Acidobacteria bacterium 13_1_20CM_2_65_9]
MSIMEIVICEIQQIAAEKKGNLPALTDDLVLLESGLDSLGIAILVARLEETLGLDPFTESDDISYPVTLGDFVRFYENAAKSRDVASGYAR